MRLKKTALGLLAALFIYLSLYSWNLRTGQLDRIATFTGLEAVKWIVVPGQWASDEISDFWNRYIYLVGLKQENDLLSSQNDFMRLEIISLKEKAKEADRLAGLLAFPPVEGWNVDAARVITHRMGPSAALNSIVIDKGQMSGVHDDIPIMTPYGVVGRVMQTGLSASNVLLVTDPNSRISVRGQSHRASGLLIGGGDGRMLQLKYMKLNAMVDKGEILITSGLAGIFPPGLPVARVTSVERSDISLFLKVQAEPLVDIHNLEAVLLVRKDVAAATNSTSASGEQ
ncbi:rod shape-determining protein MreC [Maridesulfovibrio bastinii]|uniref:rod shape-determining protein MreC n=1 Tax=Maridesulfovibrio bastinii TaxID=47157 RepID=UPI00041AA822|nr:rod shape-determining protein MreC [Maridesulfovibrio bastinii]